MLLFIPVWFMVPGQSALAGSANKPAGEPFSLERLWTENTYRPASIRSGRSMEDGLYYTMIQGGIHLCRFAYESGALTDTLFSLPESLWPSPDERGRINSYAFSAGEQILLIGIEEERIYRRSRKARYYLYHFENQLLVELDPDGKQMVPGISPDGEHIAWVRDNNIFVSDVYGSERLQITRDGSFNEIINGHADWVYEEEFSLSRAWEWSHDGRYLAWIRFDEAHVREFNMVRYGTLYPVDYRFKYPKAGEENARVSLHVWDRIKNQQINLDTGGDAEAEAYIPRIYWSPGTQELAFLRLNRHQNRMELMLGDIASGQSRPLYVESNIYYVDLPLIVLFLEDGKHFLISSEKSGYRHLYLFDMQGRQQRALTSGDYDVQRFVGLDQQRSQLYYLARKNSPMTNHLYRVGLNGRGRIRLSQEQGTHDPSFSAGFQYYINQYSSISRPPVYSVHNADGALLAVREDNQALVDTLDAHGFVPPEFFSFTTDEGTELNGWMIRPPDFDPSEQYPVLMYVYGGPDSQTVLDRWNAGNGIWFQHLARQGMVVVSVDNRGTGGRGELFRKMTYMQLGKYEAGDQAAAARHLAALPWIDGSRIGIFGWSYGGYLSLLSLANHADEFAAAISVAPVTSWRFYDTIYTERYMRTPQENPDGYDNNSPLNHAGKIRGDLLLVHGTADDNVHMQHSLEMITALYQHGVPFELMLYTDHDHSINTPGVRLHLYRLMTDFLMKNLF